MTNYGIKEKILCIAAHPDDTEIMAASEICRAYTNEDIEFFACITTDGGNADVRNAEQREAAEIGKYTDLFLLGYSSNEIKGNSEQRIVNNYGDIIKDYINVINKIKPTTIITHNPFDTHATHKAVFNKVVEAIKSMPEELRPEMLFGGEVWGSIMNSEQRTVNSCGLEIIEKEITNTALYKKLLSCFPSQTKIIEEFSGKTVSNYLDMTEYML